MSAYNPPIENVPIFDSALFSDTNSDTLTIPIADKRYLRFPIGQGQETIPSLIVSGTTTLNGSVAVNNNSAITLNGNSNIQQTASTTANNLTETLFETSFGTSLSPTIQVGDTIANQYIAFIPNSSSYNPATTAGNEVILAIGNAIGTETLELTTWSATNSSVKVAPTSVSMGAGGTTSTPTTSVVCNGTSVVVAPSITFPDTRVQNSAFTGAGALTGSYTNTNMTIDANGKITALANGSTTIPSNLTPNSVNITSSVGTAPNPSAGISNAWNSNSAISFSGYGGRTIASYNGDFIAGTGIQIDSWTGTALSSSPSSLFELNFTFFKSDGTEWGQTYCYLQLYPNKLFTFTGTDISNWNINNKINGDDSYVVSSPTYAPNGRWYWTYQQNFSGVSGTQAFLNVHQNYLTIVFQLPSSGLYYYECNFRCLDNTSLTSTGNSWNIYTFSP